MKEVLENFKKNKTATAIMLCSVLVTSFMLYSIVRGTYALDNHTVVFNRAENTEVMKRCTTDVNGKLTSDCLDEIAKVCSLWSPDQCYHSGCVGDYQGNSKSISQLAEMVFTQDTNYYCKGGSSQPGYNKGCYVCNADNTVMKWGFSGSADEDCPGGYTKDSSKTEAQCAVNACYECKDDPTIMEWRTSDISDDKCPAGYNKTNKKKSQCKYTPPSACYECKDDATIMEWRTNGDADDKCTSGYNKTNKTQAECKYTPPSACYECKTDSTVMEWRNNGDADDKCTSGYNKTNKTQAECKYTPPQSACYECKADTNIMKWSTSGTGDNSCPGGYQVTNKPQSECKTIVPENPRTGSFGAIFTIIMAAVAITCSCWYLKRSV